MAFFPGEAYNFWVLMVRIANALSVFCVDMVELAGGMNGDLFG